MFEIGNSLREARLRQKLDFPELEQAVKVRAKYLRALEEEEFDILPAATYVKGFLRAYADCLGLDGQLYVDEYNSRFVKDEEHARPLRPRRSSVPPRRHRRLEAHVLVIGLTLIVAATALVIVAWRFGGTSGEQTHVANLTPKPAAGAARPLPKVPVVRRKAAEPKKAVPPKLARLLATAAKGNVWLEVHTGTATGRLLFQGTLERGRSQLFTARQIWMNVGVPENLSLRLNGRVVRLARTSAPQVLLVSPRGVARA